jgi:hypothetical protein
MNWPTKTPSTLGRSKGAGTLWRTACNCWSWCCDLHYRWFNSLLFFKWPIETDDLPIKHGDYMWLSIVFCMFTRPGIIPARLQLTLWDDPGGHGTDCERLVPLMATARSCIRDVTVKGPIYPAFGVPGAVVIVPPNGELEEINPMKSVDLCTRNHR